MENEERQALLTHINLLTAILTVAVILIGIEAGAFLAVTRRYMDAMKQPVIIEEVITEATPEATAIEDEEVEEVFETVYEAYFTNYYVNDATGATNKTGSGKTTNDFMVNEFGWYTYNDKIVLAGATYEGLKSNYGILANYNEEIDGIIYHNYGDVVMININGVEYEAIILDTCGACMVKQKSDNDVQRYDIMIAGKEYAFGKVKGEVK